MPLSRDFEFFDSNDIQNNGGGGPWLFFTGATQTQINLTMGVAPAGVATVTSSLSGSASLNALMAGVATVTDSLTGAGSLNVLMAGAATVTDSLTGAGSLNALMAGVGTVTAALSATNDLGTVAMKGAATVTAALSILVPISAVMSGVATMTLQAPATIPVPPDQGGYSWGILGGTALQVYGTISPPNLSGGVGSYNYVILG